MVYDDNACCIIFCKNYILFLKHVIIACSYIFSRFFLERSNDISFHVYFIDIFLEFNPYCIEPPAASAIGRPRFFSGFSFIFVYYEREAISFRNLYLLHANWNFQDIYDAPAVLIKEFLSESDGRPTTAAR